MERYKYRICFRKIDAMRFIGHLDLLRLFQRAVKRSGLPIAYSAGFNPHQLISFAMPLPIGHASVAEYADIEFTREVEDMKPLDAQLPQGLTIVRFRPFLPEERAGAALAAAALYKIEFPAGVETTLDTRVAEILSAETLIIEKRTKSGSAMTDIRPDIIELRAEKNILHAMLAAGSARNLKPESVAGCIHKNASEIKYTRMEIYKKIAKGYEALI